MKQLFLLFLLMAFSLGAQEEIQQEVLVEDSLSIPVRIYDEPDVEALFPGGKGSLLKYISSCVEIPTIATELGISLSTQHIRFVVRSNGKITDIELLKGIPDCPECDEAVLTCFRVMPDWIPAQVDGKLVNSRVVMPLNICLR